jgi:hypothetical protein
MKDYLVLSYEGDVLIKHIPNNVKREDIIDIARQVIEDKRQRAMTGLSNIKTIKNYEIDEYFRENPWIKESIHTVEYEDYK